MLTKTQNNVVSYSGAAAVFMLALACFGRSPISVAVDFGADEPHAAGSGLACAMWAFHFARRTLESAFLEKHSQLTVPLADSLCEFAYYWLFAAWIASVFASTSPPSLPSPVSPSFALCGWAMAEFTNFYAHRVLSRNPSKDGKRVVPSAPPFRLVCCPHYLAEILSWLCFSLCCPCVPSVLFALAGGGIMTGYALERHRKYIVDDPAFARSARKAIVPFIL